MKWNEFGERLASLEEDLADQLISYRLENWPVWQCVKSNLYFWWTNQAQQGRTGNTYFASQHGYRLLAALPGDLRSWLSLVRKRGKERLPWVYAHTVDRQVVNLGGQSRNLLCDPFVQATPSHSWIYAEVPLEGVYRRPAAICPNLPLGPLLILRRPLVNFAHCLPTLRKLARRMSLDLGRSFLLYKLPMAPSPERLLRILAQFWTELQLHRRLFACSPPKYIVTSEQVGTAMLAAAKELDIAVLDLQHGLIDRYHPYYQYAQAFRRWKKDLILPNYLGVFGEIHKRSLLETGFWKDTQVLVIGSSRLETIRRQKANLVKAAAHILVATQWILPEETLQLISQLANAEPEVPILVRPHPLESPETLRKFEALASQQAGRVRIVPPNSDLSEQIMQARLVVGFDSTVLLESVAFGRPVITVGTDSMPGGIHDLVRLQGLEGAIKRVHIRNPGELSRLISKTALDHDFYRDWCALSQSLGEQLFALDYDLRVNSALGELGRAQDTQ